MRKDEIDATDKTSLDLDMITDAAFKELCKLNPGGVYILRFSAPKAATANEPGMAGNLNSIHWNW